MRTRLSVLCDKVIEAGWLAAVVLVPLFFNIYSQRVFEPDKISLLRSLALVMSAAWLIGQAEEWRASRNESTSGGLWDVWARARRTPMVVPVLLLILAYLISTVLSISPRVSFLGSYQRLQGTYTTLSYLVVFFLVLAKLRSRRQLNRLVTTAILTSFPIAMYGLVQHFGLDPLPWGGDVTTRLASNMGNAIFVAAYLIMLVPLTLTRLLENWKEAVGDMDWRDGALGAVAFVLLAASLMAGMVARRSSGAGWLVWVALVVGLALQAPIYLLTPGQRRTRVLAISLPLTFAFLVGFSWVQEILFPPPPGAEAPGFLWTGILAAVVFFVAMVAFALYLRKPIARLLLLSAYWVILIAQVVCIFYSGSRGPLLGLAAGALVYFAILGLVKRQVWLSWTVGAATLALVGFLVVFNLVDAPPIEKLREVPYVGRLGRVLETDRGTGKVRVLIWQGVTQMMAPHDPLQYPGDGGGTDTLNAIRPVFGYGPESMYVAYNRFYPADLAHFERRNASPDRSHNETFDALATTGVFGLLIYMSVFASVVYYALKWLGLIQVPWQKWAFIGLWVGGGVVGAAGAWAWFGPPGLGVGIPGGMVLGLAVYLLVVIIASAQKRASASTAGFDALLVLGLFSGIVAHFVEIHFGIAIASTRTYFWVYTALLVILGTRITARPKEPAPGMNLVASGQDAEPTVRTLAGPASPAAQARSRAVKGGDRGRAAKPSGGKAIKSRGRRAAGPLPVRSIGLEGRSLDWWGSIVAWSFLTVLVLGTLLFDFTTVQSGAGAVGTIWKSLTEREGQSSPIMLVMLLGTWAMAGVLGLADLGTRDESKQIQNLDWLRGAGVYLLVSLIGTLIFGLQHAARLGPVTMTSPDAPNPLADTIVYYYVFVFLVVCALALVLTFMFRRTFSAWRWEGRVADLAVVASLALVPLAAVAVSVSNVQVVHADILYKQGLSSEKVSDWDGAIFFYGKAIEEAPEEDFYYLFLGRARMEKGRTASGEERDTLLEASEKALQRARQIAPLNTDHSANLGRLFRMWAGVSSEPKRSERFAQALTYYSDATRLSPNNAQLFNEWAQTYWAMGDADRALEKYQQSLAIDKAFVQTYLLLGEFYLDQGLTDQAAQAYLRATELTKSADAWSALGYLYSQKGDLQKAVEAYEKAVEAKPQNFTHRKNLAVIYQQLGRKEDALREAMQALELAPEAQRQSMETFIAELGAQTSLLSPEDAHQVQTLLDEGRSLMEGEDWAGAAKLFEQALQIQADNFQAHSALAYVYAKLGRIEEAIAETESALRVVPDDYNNRKNLALLYEADGRLTDAIAAAEQALTAAPDEEKEAMQAYLEQLRRSLGSPATATPEARRAGDLKPEDRNGMYSAPPPMTIDLSKSYTATIVTEKGNIVVELAAAQAPQTVNNFVYLARQGFYDGLTFHRVLDQPGFSLIQGGDPSGSGRGGPGYSVPAEIGLEHREGAIAMARLADEVNPDRASSGSQFYIVREAIPSLDGGYTVFGYTVRGLDVAARIEVGDKILRIEIAEQ